jgi:hypothetical protein
MDAKLYYSANPDDQTMRFEEPSGRADWDFAGEKKGS